VTLHHGGDGDRVQGALETDLTAADVEDLRTRLARLDKAKKWTRKVLELIRANPRIAASKLALKLKRETEPFKVDVRKLKRLGLTQSFEVGYELSPRGVKFLELETSPRRPAQKRRS
jgi:DNA-binding Lrp family transcriptional regulator